MGSGPWPVGPADRAPSLCYILFPAAAAAAAIMIAAATVAAGPAGRAGLMMADQWPLGPSPSVRRAGPAASCRISLPGRPAARPPKALEGAATARATP